jgi:hypothetical protein
MIDLAKPLTEIEKAELLDAVREALHPEARLLLRRVLYQLAVAQDQVKELKAAETQEYGGDAARFTSAQLLLKTSKVERSARFTMKCEADDAGSEETWEGLTHEEREDYREDARRDLDNEKSPGKFSKPCPVCGSGSWDCGH